MNFANQAEGRDIFAFVIYLMQQERKKNLATRRRKTIKILKSDYAVEKKVGEIFSQVLLTNSEERLDEFLRLVKHIKEPEVFWRAFCETWSCCDATWSLRDRLLHELQTWKGHCSSMHPCEYLAGNDADFFRSQPNLIKIYRGASVQRIKGFAWTTDHNAALGFARGHRGIPVPNPVIASTDIHKDDIFIATNDRQESEVVVDFERLTKISIEQLT